MGTNKDPQVAKWFAATKHFGQSYGQQPYTYHLEQAVQQLDSHILGLPVLRFHDHDVIVCATWLHDVIEDTETQKSELGDLFCGSVVELVHAVTDGEGRNRAERKQRVYEEIRMSGPAALAVKLADRLANALACGLSKDPNAGMLQMYRKEQTKFEQELGVIGGFSSVFATIRRYLGIG
jgi:(p)ppGpp synthase/HD superfamily hydrolase